MRKTTHVDEMKSCKNSLYMPTWLRSLDKNPSLARQGNSTVSNPVHTDADRKQVTQMAVTGRVVDELVCSATNLAMFVNGGAPVGRNGCEGRAIATTAACSPCKQSLRFSRQLTRDMEVAYCQSAVPPRGPSEKELSMSCRGISPPNTIDETKLNLGGRNACLLIL